MTVTIPAICPPVEQVDTNPQQQQVGKIISVLLVEDNQDARESLRDALGLYGFEVIEAADGITGIDFATRLKPKVAVVDIGLPGIDGFEVGRRLRSLSHGPSMLLVAVSGYGQPEAQQSAAEAGFDHFVIKPVAPDKLAALISAARTS